MGKILLRLLLIFTLAATFTPVEAQRIKRTKSKKSKAKFEENKVDHKAAELKAEEEGRKAHIKLQDRDVRKRMRQSARKAKRHRENKRSGFVRRLFTKK